MMQFASLPAAASGEWLPAQTLSIGRLSRELKNRHLVGRIWRVMAGVVGVFAASLAYAEASRAVDGTALLLTALAAILIAALLLRYPRLKVPPARMLAELPVGEIPGKTQLWLETCRSDLPPQAARALDQVAIQLDAIALQLEPARESRPHAEAVRSLIGRQLPGIVCTYLAAVRAPPPAIAPEARLIEQLGLCGHHISLLSRRLGTAAIRR